MYFLIPNFAAFGLNCRAGMRTRQIDLEIPLLFFFIIIFPEKVGDAFPKGWQSKCLPSGESTYLLARETGALSKAVYCYQKILLPCKSVWGSKLVN
jgi:hypothetical protein